MEDSVVVGRLLDAVVDIMLVIASVILAFHFWNEWRRGEEEDAMFIDDDECRYFGNDHAVDEFCEVIGKIEDELDELTAMAQNRMDLIPQEITWGTVGAARHILLLLRQAKAYAKRAGNEPQE